MTASDSFDRNALLAKLGGDEDFVRGLLAVALRTSGAVPAQLRAACAAADLDALAKLAHKVKGTAGDLVAEPLRVQARDAELAARGADPGAIALSLDLADALERLLVDLRHASTGALADRGDTAAKRI